MEIRLYNKAEDEAELMEMIENEEGWTYSEAHMSERYRRALESSITYVAYENGVMCGYSRSLEDSGFYYIVIPALVIAAAVTGLILLIRSLIKSGNSRRKRK